MTFLSRLFFFWTTSLSKISALITRGNEFVDACSIVGRLPLQLRRLKQ